MAWLDMSMEKKMMKNKALSGHLMALACILIWGFAASFTKILTNNLPNGTVQIVRSLMCYGFLCVLNHDSIKLSFKEELLYIGCGFFGKALYQIFELNAYSRIPASIASVLISTSPVMIGILSMLIYKEKLSKWFIPGFIVSIAGICMISITGVANLNADPVGLLFAILVAMTYAIQTMIIRKILALPINVTASTRRITFWGIVFTIPIMLATHESFDFTGILTLENVIAFLYVGLLSSAGTALLWNFSITILGAVKTSIYIYAIPVVAVIASMIILHETITPVILAGIAITIVGVILSGKK